jgi:dolichol-phosphate mannosyltransferase
MRKLTGLDFASASDYKLLSRPVVDAWLKLGERNLFFRGMVAWLGFRVERIPFEVAPRVGGRTRWTTPRLVKLALTGMTAYSAAPLRLATVLGGLFFLFAVALGIQSLVMKFTGRALTGFTTVILLQLIIGSLVLLVLGIIGEYLARIYEEVKGRPRYVVAETLEGGEGEAAEPAGDEK